jgi:cyanophycin synthetase
MDPTVDAGVFEMTPGGLLRGGLVLDGPSVGALLDVHGHHLGAEGIETTEEMADVGGLVVRHAREWAILDADDPLILGRARATRARSIGLVSREAGNVHVQDHVARGGMAVVIEPRDAGAWVVLRHGPATHPIIALDDRAAPTAANPLFATAIAFGLGMEVPIIRRGLVGFSSDVG